MSGNLSLRDYLDVEERLFSESIHGWRRIPAGLKMSVAGAAIAANVVVARFALSAALFVVAASILVWSRVPRRHLLLFLLAPAWATLIVAAGFSVGFGQTRLIVIGPVTIYREGVLQGLNAAVRVAADCGWMAALFLTTPFTEMLSSLRRIRVPGILVDTLSFMYRYVFLLWDEFERMWTAARARGGMSTRGRKIDTVSRMAAQIFLQAYDRAERIDISIRARGGQS